MTMGLEATAALTKLTWRDDVGLVFDRARPQQRLPVHRARVGGESSGHENKLRALLGEPAIEFRKAQIVTDAKPHRAQLTASHRDRLAGSARVRFAQRNAVGKIDVE